MPSQAVLNVACIVIAAGLSCALTAAMRRYSIRAGMLDAPNARSSHTVPTPRGGGAAIVATFLLAVLSLTLAKSIETSLCLAIMGSGLLVAALGFMDDHSHLSARWRFMGHLAAAAWVLWWMAWPPPVPLLGYTVDLGAGAVALAALFLVWSINLFNFMDGIDGIASLEAVFVALGGAWVWWLVNPAGPWYLPIAFAACVAGFLVWNFPPARIFMGDVGSGFLGLSLALMALWSSTQAPQLFWSWFILGGCFMVDATTTLVRRVRRGERFHVAHRSHAYQYASRKHASHKRVTLAFCAVNVCWLLPWALLVARGTVDGVLAVLVSFAPLVWLAFRYKAGARDQQEI